MTQPEVIKHLCETVALVYQSIGDYSEPSDGFCHECPYSGKPSFKHSGKTLEYVRLAVAEKLKADGYEIADGFNRETGDPDEAAKPSFDKRANVDARSLTIQKILRDISTPVTVPTTRT